MHATVKRKIWSSPYISRSEPSKFDKTRSGDKFLLLNMKINDESKYILICKKGLPTFLEDTASTFFFWGKPPDLILKKSNYENNI